MNPFLQQLQQMYGQTAGQQPGIGLSHLPQMAVNPHPQVPNVQAPHTDFANLNAQGFPGQGAQSGYGMQPPPFTGQGLQQGGGEGLRMPGPYGGEPGLKMDTGMTTAPRAGLLDDPTPNMAERARRLGGMMSEGPRQAPLQPLAPPTAGVGGRGGIDVTPFLRRGIRPGR